VPVVPEMELWRKWPDTAPECESVRKHQVKAVYAEGVNLYRVYHTDGWRETPITMNELFSTREATEQEDKADAD